MKNKNLMFNILKTKFTGYGELDGVKGYHLYKIVTQKISLNRNVIFYEHVILPTVAHGSTFTQLPPTQPLMAPPQNNSHIYLVDEIINNPQNNQVHPLPFQPQIHLVNTPIIP
jgi:hypothetical protein